MTEDIEIVLKPELCIEGLPELSPIEDLFPTAWEKERDCIWYESQREKELAEEREKARNSLKEELANAVLEAASDERSVCITHGIEAAKEAVSIAKEFFEEKGYKLIISRDTRYESTFLSSNYSRDIVSYHEYHYVLIWGSERIRDHEWREKYPKTMSEPNNISTDIVKEVLKKKGLFYK